jgi:hypothetical protein
MAESSDKLAAALEAIPGCPPEMVVCTKYGYYHDYESPLTTPELQLVADLRVLVRAPQTPAKSRPMYEALIKRVIDGEFDATKAESDAWMASADGQAAMRSLTGR